MPNVYKKKTCPQCNKEHRQRGVYCSISCGNSARIITQETKDKITKSVKEYTLTPEGVAHAHQASRMRKQVAITNQKIKNNEYIPVEDDWLIEIPVEDEDKDNIRW